MKILLILIMAAAVSGIASYGVLFPGFDVGVQGIEVWDGRQDILDAGGQFICECEIDGIFSNDNCDMDMDGQFDEMFQSSQLLCTFVAPGEDPPDDGTQGEGEGCIGAYWSNQISTNSDEPSNWPPGYEPNYYYNNIFHTNIGLSDNKNPTLQDALNANKGGWDTLARESTAAILNAAHWDVDYQFTVPEVMYITQATLIGGAFSEDAVKELMKNNRMGAPICPPNENQENEDMVLICHKGNAPLNIAKPALAAHLAHGDIQGVCPNTENSDEDFIDNDKEKDTDKGDKDDNKGKEKDTDKGDKD